MSEIKWEARNLFDNWIIVDEKDNVINIRDNEKVAKLIASAPEMLEQLKESLAVISWYMDNTKPEENQYSDFFNIGMNQRQVLEDLILKATE